MSSFRLRHGLTQHGATTSSAIVLLPAKGAIISQEGVEYAGSVPGISSDVRVFVTPRYEDFIERVLSSSGAVLKCCRGPVLFSKSELHLGSKGQV